MKKRTPRLGQHFLKNPRFAQELVRAAELRSGDTTVEIGPGKGALTRELLATGAHVIAIEKDKELVAHLNDAFQKEIGSGQLTLVEGDIRNFNPSTWQLAAGSYSVAANIPYYITGEIIREFLTATTQPRTIALLVQKEVADRIIARDGKESILSLSVKAYGKPRIVAKVSRGNFSPPPQVDSAIIAIRDISRKFFEGLDEDVFFKVVRTGFSSRRKLLAGNLKKIASSAAIANVFSKVDIADKARAEDISLEQWSGLARQLSVTFPVSA
jgi:16S rRNA (adenine1518-N6/adenine1519-N6)-dimethyltransferase